MGKRFKAEEIVMKLREIELAMNKGIDAVQASRQAGVPKKASINVGLIIATFPII